VCHTATKVADQGKTGEPNMKNRLRFELALGLGLLGVAASAGSAQESACTDTLTANTSEACNVCGETYCAAEGEACDEQCLSLLSCVVDQCGGNGADASCIVANCADCLGAATTAQAVGNCLSANCADQCEFVEPPPPPPTDGCVDELDDAVGAECTECAAALCPDETAACDGDCRSLLTCAMYECGGSGDPACITAGCASCVGAASTAQATADCMMERCPDVCPPAADDGDPGTDTPGGGAAGSGGESGDDDDDADTPDDEGSGMGGGDSGSSDPGDDDAWDAEPNLRQRLVAAVEQLIDRVRAALRAWWLR
jgi:hypothetical protein